jgi:biopolymer transport protein ExbB
VTILALMSVAALAIILLKLHQFWRLGARLPENAVRAVEAHHGGEAVEAQRLARSCSGFASAIFSAGLGAGSSADPGLVREEMTRLAADHLARLRSHFRTLEMIASLAPLLGLFGTVLGMIAAFQELEAAGSEVNPAVLSGGIWEALLTTAVGLAVAIPTVAALNLLEQRVDRLAHELDSLISRFFTRDGGAMGSTMGAFPEGAPETTPLMARNDARLQPAPAAGF